MKKKYGIVLALIFSSGFSTVLAQDKTKTGRPSQTSASNAAPRTTAGKKRQRKLRRAAQEGECMPQQNSTSQPRRNPAGEAPNRILDPTDSGPPGEEIVPMAIDPAEMPSIKEPQKPRSKQSPKSPA